MLHSGQATFNSFEQHTNRHQQKFFELFGHYGAQIFFLTAIAGNAPVGIALASPRDIERAMPLIPEA